MRFFLLYLIIISTTFLSCKKPTESCFRLSALPTFIVGEKLNFKDLKINYGPDSEGKNFGMNNGLKDFGSGDSSISILKDKGTISGLLTFVTEDKTDKLVSLNCFWTFMIDDKAEDRLNALKEIKEKYLKCLDLNKIDTKTGGQYSEKNNGWTETYNLVPRIRENGIDATFWAFYYSIK